MYYKRMGDLMKNVKKVLLILIGSISVFLGVIGIFLPILPTTPFLLLGAACYIKSSKTLYLSLINNKYLGSYIKNYYEKKGIPLKTKRFVITILWISISFSAFFVINHLYLQIMLFTIASIVTWHIAKQKTLEV